MKLLFPVGDHAMQLSAGNPYAPFAKLLEDERFRDLSVIVLIKNEAAQGRPKVRRSTVDIKLAAQHFAARGQPFLDSVARGHILRP